MDDASLRTLVQEVAKRELREDDRAREDSLRQFRDWVIRNPNIRNCRTDDDFLLGFLRTRKFSINQAQQLLLKFMGCRQKLAKFTKNLDILDPDLDRISSKAFAYRSPTRDAHGRYIFILHIGAVRSSEVTPSQVGRYKFMNTFTMMNDLPSQVMGYIYVIDVGDVDAGHATFWNPLEMLEALGFIQNALPIRHKEIHIIRLNSVMQIVLRTMLNMLSKKLQSRVQIHSTLEDLHKKVSPDVLPKEYGGKMPAKEMSDLWRQKLIESRDMVLGMEDMTLLVDDDANNVETGSFRKLAID